MAHELEMIDGKGQMVYVGDTPWHGLGTQIPNDLTPEQILKTAKLDWTVEKQDIFLANGTVLSDKALVRSTDSKVLDIVSNKWNPVQNEEAFEFFNDFVLSGNMEMHTAGSLKGGQIVWALAKVKESFEIFGGDVVDSYLLFSNPHKFGTSVDVKFTPIRVVCNNTLTYALSNSVNNQVKMNHCRKFNGDVVKETLGISKEILAKYKEQALFLGSKKFNTESIVGYFERVFPKTSGEDVTSRNAVKAMEYLESQPGAKYAEGSFWQAFNTVTYMNDHIIGRNVENRLHSTWYGQGKIRKDAALKLALEYAEAA
jgi:phage/plasmid-like protein (TIGR03299 family)